MDSPRTDRCRFALIVLSSVAIGCGVLRLVPVGSGPDPHARRLRFDLDHEPYRSRDVIFSHEVHESIVGCDHCHFGSAQGPSPPDLGPSAERAVPAGAVTMPSMALCFGCHDGRDLSNECIDCHRTNRKHRKPEFHDALFPRLHKVQAEKESYKCALCHPQDDCRGCHMERRPLSHTPRFLTSTHGRMATHDRRSCATCHETAFCENCHSQPPPSHTPAFRRSGGHKQLALIQGRSCLVCHSFESTCAECHG